MTTTAYRVVRGSVSVPDLLWTDAYPRASGAPLTTYWPGDVVQLPPAVAATIGPQTVVPA